MLADAVDYFIIKSAKSIARSITIQTKIARIYFINRKTIGLGLSSNSAKNFNKVFAIIKTSNQNEALLRTF